MKKLLKIFAVMFIVSVALLAVAAYVPNGDVADAVTADCTHEYSEVVLAQQPSCTQKGWLEHYTCTLCGKYFVKVGEDMVEVDREDISSPVLVHKWSDWFVKPATCTEEGGEMRYCALCGATEHRGETIGALGHNLTHHEAVASTCTAVGTKAHYECSVCHKLFVDGESGKVEVSAEELVIPTTEHTVVVDKAVEPTCTETGLTEGSHCSVCGTVLVAQEVIPATGHTVVVDEAVEPTCTETGLKEGSHCSVCGTVLVAQQEIPATGHTVVTDEGKAPTCTETGLTEGSHCSVCGTVLVAQQEIPATGHTYDAVKTGDNVCTVCHQHEITQAEIVEKLYALESGEALDGTYLLTEIVTNLDGTNATIIVEEKEIYLHSFQSTNTFLVGDRVSVVGTLKHFGNYYEFDAGTVTKVTHPEYALTFGVNVEGYTVTLADGSPVPTSATNGTTYEVKITVPSGYKVASVTVNGAVVDMSESGTYSVTVCGETTVHVEIVSKMFSGMVLEATADLLGLTSNGGYTPNNGNHTIENYIVTTNQIMLQSGVMQWQKNKGSLTVEGTFDKIVVNYTSDGLFTLKVNGVEVEADTSVAGVLTFDLGTSQTGTFVIEVGNETGKTTSIQFFATICEHEWGTWAHKSDATCTESATESRICDLCGAEEVRTVGEPLGHTWGDWTSNGNNTHTGKCSLCGEKVSENCTFENGVCSVCGAQEVVTHSVTVGYTVNGNAATTLPDGVTVEMLGKDGQPVTDLANVVEGTTLKVKITAEGFDIAVTCNSESLTLQDGEGAFVVDADVTLSVTLTTHTQHKGTAEDPYSVADALAIAGAIGQGNYTEKVYIKGLIVDVGSDRGDFRSNIYIADTADGTKMLVFSANFSEEVPSIYEGDTVVFHGYITNYEGILEIAWKEIAGKGKDYPEMTAVTRGSRPITVTMENATTTLPDSAPIESTVTFTVTPDEGYEVVSVKVNGNFITPVDGTYSFVVGETNAVEVTIQKITPKHQVSVNGDVEGYTVTTDNDITLPGEVYEGTLKFTVTAPEGYQVATVSVGETVLTLGDDGYYTTEVAGEITISIEFKNAPTYVEETVTISFASTENRVSWNADQQIWSQNGITVINDKAASSNEVIDSSNPVRFYANSNLTIEYSGMVKIVVQCDGSKRLLEAESISNGGIITTSGSVTTITFEDAVDSVVLTKLTQQARVDSIEITYLAIVCDHNMSYASNNNGTHTGTCSLCGQEITEDCTYNEEHKCSVCGYAEPTRTVTVNFDETNESSTFGNYQWVNENGDVVEAPGDVYAGTVLYLKVSVNDYTTHTISEVKATDTTLEVVAEDDGSKTYKFVVGTGDITITITFGEAGATKTWKLVTDVTTLKAGDQIVLANVANNAIAGDISKSVMQKLACTFNADNSEIPELPNNAVVLTLGGNEGSWTFANSNGQLLGTTDAKKVEWSSGTTTWTISISNGDATIDSTESSCGYLQYNKNSPRFTTYTSKQTLPQIFKLS